MDRLEDGRACGRVGEETIGSLADGRNRWQLVGRTDLRTDRRYEGEMSAEKGMLPGWRRTIAIAIAIAKLIYIALLTLTTIVQQRFPQTKKIQKYNIKQRQC